MSRPPLTQRTVPLSTPEIALFFDPTTNGHLKYRMTMLILESPLNRTGQFLQ
jgi:hypothetical protein